MYPDRFAAKPNVFIIPFIFVCGLLIAVFHRTVNTEKTDVDSSAVSGKPWVANKIRTYRESYLQVHRDPIGTPDSTYTCAKWAVTTTIHSPTKSIWQILDQTDTCVVIVADIKTPTSEYLTMNERVIFLSVEKQKRLKDWDILHHIPWNHFGRKNLGYLYAIYHGAQSIYDFDDDNELILNVPNASSFQWQMVNAVEVLNPYPLFIQLEDVSWPRGFPLTQIQNTSTWNVTTRTVDNLNIGVIQSLANHDPDMDAIWRLTRKLPLTFDQNKHFVLPLGTYSSYNAQATIHYALWGTLLPVSVHGRVSDIWRSYIMQRLMQDVGVHIAFVSPFVIQIRNAHNYLGDYMSERPLYEKTEELIRILNAWSSSAKLFEQRFVELFIELYERDFIGLLDVQLAKSWVITLKQLGYEFPEPV